jgi:hypothetical protein
MRIACGECVRHALQPTYDHTIATTGVWTAEPRFFAFVRLDPKTDDLARSNELGLFATARDGLRQSLTLQ